MNLINQENETRISFKKVYIVIMEWAEKGLSVIVDQKDRQWVMYNTFERSTLACSTR